MVKFLSNKNAFILLLFICSLTTLPFLGLTDFNTKGEPREAIVAYTMLDTGNWTLPTNNGGEMAYKPPFFHWCIAAFSTLTGGKVTEYTSRFPSAFFGIIMLLAGYCFFARRKDPLTAFLAALITFTTFEVHRALFACRVDMVLTSCMVMALYCLYSWAEKGSKRLPWWAILWMGLGALTKGPVAALLPCAVLGAFNWMQGRKFWATVSQCLIILALSLVLPSIWYLMAYQQGGDEFLTLVKEENLDRFMGKMSYGSHENPWTYNLIMIISGFVPWTLLLLISLFFLSYRNKLQFSKNDKCHAIGQWATERWTQLKAMDPVRLFALLSAVIIFVFYCIPKSKRGVYLLPVYPFVAYFVAEYVVYIVQKHGKAIKIFGGILAGLSLTLVSVFIVVKCGVLPADMFKGRSGAENNGFVAALYQLPIWGRGMLAFIPVLCALFWFYKKNLWAICVMLVGLFFSLDVAYQPTILNTKSDLPIARDIEKIVPQGPIDSFVAGYMMHFFTINFYLHDRVGVFDAQKATEGYLLVGSGEVDAFMENHTDFNFELIYESTKGSCDIRHQQVQMYRYIKK